MGGSTSLSPHFHDLHGHFQRLLLFQCLVPAFKHMIGHCLRILQDLRNVSQRSFKIRSQRPYRAQRTQCSHSRSVTAIGGE